MAQTRKSDLGGRWRRTGEILGTGGQAQVFVVSDLEGKTEGNSAAKVLLNANRVPRLEREIETAQLLYSKGAPVLPILDHYDFADENAGRPWFVTPIAAGGSLGNKLSDGGPHGGSVDSALTCFIAIATAVKKVHKEGIAHRDLKPDNILLLNDKDLVLGDLGLCLPLADSEGERLTGALERIGSINYLPPEAFGKRPLDQNQYAFDAFALGKILYRLVSGRQLPGFVSPMDEDYDLTKAESSPITRGVNRTLRGLLHDSPIVRLESLNQIEEQITDLLAASRAPSTTLPAMHSKLEIAAAALASKLTANGEDATSPKTNELDFIRSEIAAAWDESHTLKQIDDILVRPNSELVEMVVNKNATVLRNQVRGIQVRTKRGLEPIEDKGYPTFPNAEIGCGVTIQPKNEAAFTLIALGALAVEKAGRVWVAIATATRELGKETPTDIVLGTEHVKQFGLHDASLIPAVREMANQALQQFADVVARSLIAKDDK